MKHFQNYSVVYEISKHYFEKQRHFRHISNRSSNAYHFLLQVARHREHLLNYIIFLRITPFLPNWFINITSPVIDVPLMPFFVGSFLGM